LFLAAIHFETAVVRIRQTLLCGIWSWTNGCKSL